MARSEVDDFDVSRTSRIACSEHGPAVVEVSPDRQHHSLMTTWASSRPENSINGSIPYARWGLCKSIQAERAPFAAPLKSPLPDSNWRPLLTAVVLQGNDTR
jgi:hypothetical protein